MGYYVKHNYHSYNDSFNEVAPYIRKADIAVGNLESLFVSEDVSDSKFKGAKSAILDSSPEAVSALRYRKDSVWRFYVLERLWYFILGARAMVLTGDRAIL